MKFIGLIHEHPELGINEGPGPTVVLSDVHIAHVGYLVETTRRKRFGRNYPLLKRDIEKYPERLLQKHFICRDNMLLCMYDMQRNGGKVTQEIRARCEETIDLYRRYFLGKGGYLNADTIQYYSQACSILGLGAEVAYQIAADKSNAQPNGTHRYRFATAEDLEKEISKTARDAVAPFVSDWW